MQVDASVGQDARAAIEERPERRVDEVEDALVATGMPVLAVLRNVFQRSDGGIELISESVWNEFV